ncbi:MAG: hypothetical protein FDZ69_00205 [Deltaproteobacteria bacterium]|nr:MAG: hypothetical protein FDZ69_00205 [Deltaproteobacteria bacterium]
MVSPGRLFFLHAEPLIAMHSDPGSYRIVKLRHKNPDRAIGCHAGDIVGRLDHVSSEITRVTLYFGEGGRSIELAGHDRLLHVVAVHSFYFHRPELNERVRELKRTLDQSNRFKELKLMAETVVPQSLDGNILK